MKLSEAAEIFGGKSVKKNDDNGNITVLRITNIDELGINYNDV